MTATIQLDVLGADTPGSTNFSIFTDSDLFTNVVTTRTGTQLLAGTSIIVPDGSTTVRLTTSSGCAIVKDISINQGDPSPAITPQSDTTTQGFIDSVTGNKKSEIYTKRDGGVRISTDNGITFSSESFIPTLYYTPYTSLLHNGTDLLLIALDRDSDTLKVYNVTNYYSGFNSATYTLLHSQNVPNESININNTFYINNKYYISTTIGTYRSSAITDGFVLVLPEVSLTHMDNYGNHIYGVKNALISAGGGIYKSIDNGLNWDYSYSADFLVNIDVESYTKHIVMIGTSNGFYGYTTDGGSNYVFTNQMGQSFSTDSFIYKYNSAYIIKTRDYILHSPDLYTNQITTTQVGTFSGSSNTNTNVFHPQRNTITFANQDKIHSYLITNT